MIFLNKNGSKMGENDIKLKEFAWISCETKRN